MTSLTKSKPTASRRQGARWLVAGVLLAIALGAEPGMAAPSSPASPKCLGRIATIHDGGTLHGTAHADVIVGTDGPDHIYGGGGNDTICVEGGDDVVEGGFGSDRIEGGAGDDSVSGGNGSDEVAGGIGDDTLAGDRGNDELSGGPGVDYLDAGLGDDAADGGPGDGDQVIGGVGNDRLSGGDGDRDVLEGDYGDDALDGGPGVGDIASYATAGRGGPYVGGYGVEVDLAAGTTRGDGKDAFTGLEDVVGTAFADRLLGDDETNALYGGGGIDELFGVGPSDSAYGGTGFDRCHDAAIAESCELDPASAVRVTAEGSSRRFAEGGGTPDFEVDLAGPSGAGALTGIVDFAPTLPAGSGVEVAVSLTGDGWEITEKGLPMTVGEGCRLLAPETARCPTAATPTGLLLAGGVGDDLLTVGRSVPDTVSSRLIGDGGVDTLVGGSGNDSLEGSGGEGGAVYGGGGEDSLAGGALMVGGPGSDLLIANPCGETVEGGSGIDSVSFARFIAYPVEATLGGDATVLPSGAFPGGCAGYLSGADSHIGTSVESIEGSPGNDVLNGDEANNNILGRGGDDMIHGGGGDDFLVGGEGVDSIFGDSGADRLYARDGIRDSVIRCGSAPRPIAGDIALVDARDPAVEDCADRGG